jgi:hypothetical protein
VLNNFLNTEICREVLPEFIAIIAVGIRDSKTTLLTLYSTTPVSQHFLVDKAEIDSTLLDGGVSVIELLSEHTGFLSSKGEARRALKENSIRVNKDLVDDSKTVSKDDLINGRQLLHPVPASIFLFLISSSLPLRLAFLVLTVVGNFLNYTIIEKERCSFW